MITRVWKGPELEGFDKGVQTLFIEGTTISGNEVCGFLRGNTDCKRVYLGAGGLGLVRALDYNAIIKFCQQNNIQIVIELMLTQLNDLPNELLQASYVVLTAKGPKTEYINEFKTDNHAEVKTYKLNENNSYTDLSTLDKGMYAEDVLLFERGTL